jgi:hypothetical protein
MKQNNSKWLSEHFDIQTPSSNRIRLWFVKWGLYSFTEIAQVELDKFLLEMKVQREFRRRVTFPADFHRDEHVDNAFAPRRNGWDDISLILQQRIDYLHAMT